MKKINKILDSIIKRILMTPTGTPRENLYRYIETGLIDPQTWMIIKKTRHLRKEMTKTEKTHTNKIWIERTKERATQKGIDPEQPNTMTRNKLEHWCKAKAIEDMRNKMRETGAHKSKTNFPINRTDPENHERAKYMTKMTRTETSILFAARNRMLKVKDNYKNQYRDSTCRGCGRTKETQQHMITECKAVHKDKNVIKIGLNDLFDTDQNNMKKTEKKLTKLNQIIKEWQ